MATAEFFLSRRLRASPFEPRVLEHGAKLFTLYNKMTLPQVFESFQADYEHLKQHVQLWDVACERQVEAVGPDAHALMELVTPRDLSGLQVGQGVYAPLVDEYGGIVNDPIILRVAEDRFWASIADSDVVLWMKGIAYGRGMDVKVFEPDVSPLGVQGPKADDLMADLVGEHVRDIKFFWFTEETIADTPVILARSGWSGQGGFEIYLQDASKALDLWDAVWAKGEKYKLRAGCPNLIERLETGLMSYGTDMTLDNNPLECGFDRFMKLGKDAEYMSRDALDRIAAEGIRKKLVNLVISGSAHERPRESRDVLDPSGTKVGIITSQAFSPKYNATLAFALVDIEHASIGTELQIDIGESECRAAKIHNRDWSGS
jgi:dimethylsulfoniopropionate demethylase